MPTHIIYALVAFIASALGAVSGIGGGVIIKPVLDSIGGTDISTVNFLSGCTVLSMALSSYIRNAKNNVNLNYRISFPLALGASAGGIWGKFVFSGFGSSLGLIQSVLLLLLNLGVMVYVMNKSKIKTHKIENIGLCLLIGLILGGISSFLGIGGGPVNIAVLSYLFSMSPKETAKNSLFIILFSQISSLMTTIVTKSVPSFQWSLLILMCICGIAGAITGSALKLDDSKTERTFKYLLILLIMINLYNIAGFL